jgi:phosphocarrier protein HPr
MSEMKTKVRFHDAEEVEEFVDAASKCDFDINIFYNRFIIDAKSILGILSMDLNQALTVQCYGQNPEFNRTLQRFAVM